MSWIELAGGELPPVAAPAPAVEAPAEDTSFVELAHTGQESIEAVQKAETGPERAESVAEVAPAPSAEETARIEEVRSRLAEQAPVEAVSMPQPVEAVRAPEQAPVVIDKKAEKARGKLLKQLATPQEQAYDKLLEGKSGLTPDRLRDRLAAQLSTNSHTPTSFVGSSAAVIGGGGLFAALVGGFSAAGSGAILTTGLLAGVSIAAPLAAGAAALWGARKLYYKYKEGKLKRLFKKATGQTPPERKKTQSGGYYYA